MATSPAPVVALNALDITGLSVATAPQSNTNPRAGSIYDSINLAGAQPIWFHPLKDGTHLMCVSRTWSAATPAGGTPGVYSAFTESLIPNWYRVDGLNGSITTPATPLMLSTPVTSATLTAGASQSSSVLFLLHSATITGQRQAILQHWDVSPYDSLSAGGEEVLPNVAGVVFDKGIQFVDPYLCIYGTDSVGNLYRIRKLWNRVGFNSTYNSTRIVNTGATWDYYSGTGWSGQQADLAPIQAGLTSNGPVSFASWKTVAVMSTVAQNGTAYTGMLWYSNKGLPFKTTSLSVSLGSTGNGSYCGSGLQLQSQLGASSSSLSGVDSAGIVYLTTQKSLASGQDSLLNIWGVTPISLVG